MGNLSGIPFPGLCVWGKIFPPPDFFPLKSPSAPGGSGELPEGAVPFPPSRRRRAASPLPPWGDLPAGPLPPGARAASRPPARRASARAGSLCRPLALWSPPRAQDSLPRRPGKQKYHFLRQRFSCSSSLRSHPPEGPARDPLVFAFMFCARVSFLIPGSRSNTHHKIRPRALISKGDRVVRITHLRGPGWSGAEPGFGGQVRGPSDHAIPPTAVGNVSDSVSALVCSQENC